MHNKKIDVIVISKNEKISLRLPTIEGVSYTFLNEEIGIDHLAGSQAFILAPDSASDENADKLNTLKNNFCFLSNCDDICKLSLAANNYRYAAGAADVSDSRAVEALIKKLVSLAKESLLVNAMEQAMAEQNRYAKLGELLSSITHQMRQPINAISAEAMRLELSHALDGLSDMELKDILSNINAQTKKMSLTITDFLNYLKPDRGKKNFAVSSMLSELAFIFKQPLHKDGIKLTIEQPDDISLFGVQNTLFEALLNIISNSKDAYASNPSAQRKEIIVKTKKYDSHVVIGVEDFAGGADDEAIEKMFDAYFTTKCEGEGSGLGLYITKGIIERDFAGSVKAVRTKDGEGMYIEINIPLSHQ